MMWQFLEAVVLSPWFAPTFVVISFLPFIRAFLLRFMRHQAEVEARLRAADHTMRWYDPPASWSPQDEILRLETENKELCERVEELTHQLGSGGPYRSPGTVEEYECNCPCTGDCSGPGGHDAPERHRVASSNLRPSTVHPFEYLNRAVRAATVSPVRIRRRPLAGLSDTMPELVLPVSQPKPGKIED